MIKSRFNISIQYFIYYYILGIFIPYFNLYCHEIGFSGMEIGAISSLKTFSVIIFPLFWGWLADKFAARKKIFIFVNFVSCGIWGLFLLTQNFYVMMAIMFFYALFHSPIVSFLEAFTVDFLGEDKKSYGKIRLWGSIGFIISVFITGYFLDKMGVLVVVYAIFAGAFVHSFIAFKTPEEKIQERKKGGFDIGYFLKPEILLFFTASFLMLASHSPYYTFFSVYLSDNGIGNTFIGIAWGVAVFAEIIMMYNSDFIFKRLKPYHVLIFSMTAAGLRWVVLYFTSNEAIVLASQLLHCFSYATFHMASILYIDELTPEGSKTTGQAINNALTYGFGLMAGNLVSGYFYDSHGGQILFAGAGIACFAGTIIMAVSGKLKKAAA